MSSLVEAYFLRAADAVPSLPTLIDSNTGITIWESGAIILYLIENYDKEHRLSSADTVEKWQLLQWLFFQVSGDHSRRHQSLSFRFAIIVFVG